MLHSNKSPNNRCNPFSISLLYATNVSYFFRAFYLNMASAEVLRPSDILPQVHVDPFRDMQKMTPPSEIGKTSSFFASLLGIDFFVLDSFFVTSPSSPVRIIYSAGKRYILSTIWLWPIGYCIFVVVSSFLWKLKPIYYPPLFLIPRQSISNIYSIRRGRKIRYSK